VQEKLTPGSEVYLQSALLYTTTDGARRIRISTIGLPVTDQMGAVFKGADLDSQLTMLTRHVAASLPGNTYGTGKILGGLRLGFTGLFVSVVASPCIYAYADFRQASHVVSALFYGGGLVTWKCGAW
jgi:hypothetical protein